MTKKKAQTHFQAGMLRSYGRVKGRRLSDLQQRLWDEYLPQIRIEPGADISALGQGCRDIWLEIGFGAGEHLTHMAGVYPDVLFIGAEPFVNGVAKCLVTMDKRQLSNIRLCPDDVRPLLEALPEGCLGRVDILFPDPWPKLAHHKRRIVNPVMLDMLARVMRTGATLWLATDHEEYAAWMLEQIAAHEAFEWQAKSKADWQTPPQDWITTRYQEKAAEQGIHPVFFECVRV